MNNDIGVSSDWRCEVSVELKGQTVMLPVFTRDGATYKDKGPSIYDVIV